jgi:hypothetical protein
MRVRVFVNLEAEEHNAEANGDAERLHGFFLTAFENGVVRPCHRATRKQQDHGHQKGQAEGRDGFKSLGRPDIADGFGRIKCCAEERPEKCNEEHDLGGDEQRHAETQADFSDLVVNFLSDAFENNILPPEEHDGENGQNTEDNAFQADRHATDLNLVHEHDRARGQKAGCERTYDGPDAGTDKVVRVGFACA